MPNPVDCHQFYYCINSQPSANPFQCPDGEIFDEDFEDCVVGYSCVNTCKNPCNYECIGPDIPAMISDRFDCGIYYECLSVDTPGMPRLCPDEKPFFDGLTCQEEESECCSCLAYCSVDDLLSNVIDPTNCSRYYLCVGDSFPEYPATCLSGNFDLLSGKCSNTAPCLIMCLNVVDRDGCIEAFTCEERGYFAKCPQRCDAHYYHCRDADVNHVIGADSCYSGLYFHPDTRHCVKRSECPYPDPGVYAIVSNTTTTYISTA